jgi:hypothetical protein
MVNWLVFTTCPEHKKQVQLIVSAVSNDKAVEATLGRVIPCPYGGHSNGLSSFTVISIDAVGSYPWKPPVTRIGGVSGVVSTGPVPKRVQTEAEAPTILQESSRKNVVEMTLDRDHLGSFMDVQATEPLTLQSANRRVGNVIDVTLTRGRERFTVIYPRNEVELYDKLMSTVKRVADGTYMKNAIIALLIAHGGATKSLATGFLLANGFKEATVSSVGEAVSRLISDKILYSFNSASFTFTRYPPGASAIKSEGGIGQIEQKVTSEVIGEPMFGIPETTRLYVIERLRFNPYLSWWRPDILKSQPVMKRVKTPVDYLFVSITKPVPMFRAAEDFKKYGPYNPASNSKDGNTKKQLIKLPSSFAYFLVQSGFAEWLEKNEKTASVENIFRGMPIDKVKKQVTLF